MICWLLPINRKIHDMMTELREVFRDQIITALASANDILNMLIENKDVLSDEGLKLKNSPAILVT
jgi:hypothetical protein